MTSKLANYLTLGLILTAATYVLCQREGRRSSSNDFYKNFKSPCGQAEPVGHRISLCMDEIFDIIEGKIPAAKDDNDFQAICQRFNNTERCARVQAKDCLTGLHKTAVSAVSSATKRWRQRECKTAESRARYGDPLKCAVRTGKEATGVMRRHTGMLQGIRDLGIPAEEKLTKMCCVLNSFDRELEVVYNKECPVHTQTMIGIVHAMTDDARNTLCVAPKCNGALDVVKNAKYKPPQNMLEPVVNILFQLSVN